MADHLLLPVWNHGTELFQKFCRFPNKFNVDAVQGAQGATRLPLVSVFLTIFCNHGPSNQKGGDGYGGIDTR